MHIITHPQTSPSKCCNVGSTPSILDTATHPQTSGPPQLLLLYAPALPVPVQGMTNGPTTTLLPGRKVTRPNEQREW
jgi:hypothetical protein